MSNWIVTTTVTEQDGDSTFVLASVTAAEPRDDAAPVSTVDGSTVYDPAHDALSALIHRVAESAARAVGA